MHDGPLPAFSLAHLSPFSVLAFSPISRVSSQSSDTLNGLVLASYRSTGSLAFEITHLCSSRYIQYCRIPVHIEDSQKEQKIIFHGSLWGW